MRFAHEKKTRSPGFITAGVALAWTTCTCLVLCGEYGRAQSTLPRMQAGVNLSAAGREALVPNYRADSELVLVPVRVEDKRHTSVAGLQKEYFKLYQDKVEQVITHFNSEDSPVSVGIVFDASGSMQDKIGASRDAVARVLETAGGGDEFFLAEFNGQVNLVADFTSQTAEIQNRLAWIQPRGGTALFDAIHFAIQKLRNAHNPRKALVIVSDGGDNSSRYSVSDVKNAVREADVQIYAIGILESYGFRGRSAEETHGSALLNELAVQSGGRLFEVSDPKQLPKVATKISESLRNQYMLGYIPSNSTHDGKYHQIQVKLIPPKGAPKWQASWRRGYYAPAD